MNRARPPRDPFVDALLRARPADPGADEAERCAVRVLARVAILEAGAQILPQVPWRTRARAVLLAGAACLLLGVPLLLAGGRASVDPAEAPIGATTTVLAEAAQGVPAWPWRVEAALDGDDLQRRRLLHGGIGARRALLRAAERHAAAGTIPRAKAALDLLGSVGALRGEAEASRVADLATAPKLRPGAVGLLAGSLGPYGAQALRQLLVDDHEAEGDVVAALVSLAERGRREPALQALLEGARSSRVQAAGAALAIAGASDLRRVLRALPKTLQRHPVVVEAVRAAPVTVRARLLRLAAHGDQGALLLASHAHLRGVVERLAVEAQHDDPLRARRAVALLAAHGGIPAHLALARAVEGRAGREARASLRALGVADDERLLHHARASPRDALAVVAAMGERGSAGLAALSRLAAQPRIAGAALKAIEQSEAPGASLALAGLAGRRALRDLAVDALGRRLRGGDARARDALLGLAEHGHARSVLRVLRASGEAGRTVLDTDAGRALARGDPRARRRGSRPARTI